MDKATNAIIDITEVEKDDKLQVDFFGTTIFFGLITDIMLDRSQVTRKYVIIAHDWLHRVAEQQLDRIIVNGYKDIQRRVVADDFTTDLNHGIGVGLAEAFLPQGVYQVSSVLNDINGVPIGLQTGITDEDAAIIFSPEVGGNTTIRKMFFYLWDPEDNIQGGGVPTNPDFHTDALRINIETVEVNASDVKLPSGTLIKRRSGIDAFFSIPNDFKDGWLNASLGVKVAQFTSQFDWDPTGGAGSSQIEVRDDGALLSNEIGDDRAIGPVNRHCRLDYDGTNNVGVDTSTPGSLAFRPSGRLSFVIRPNQDDTTFEFRVFVNRRKAFDSTPPPGAFVYWRPTPFGGTTINENNTEIARFELRSDGFAYHHFADHDIGAGPVNEQVLFAYAAGDRIYVHFTFNYESLEYDLATGVTGGVMAIAPNGPFPFLNRNNWDGRAIQIDKIETEVTSGAAGTFDLGWVVGNEIGNSGTNSRFLANTDHAYRWAQLDLGSDPVDLAEGELYAIRFSDNVTKANDNTWRLALIPEGATFQGHAELTKSVDAPTANSWVGGPATGQAAFMIEYEDTWKKMVKGANFEERINIGAPQDTIEWVSGPIKAASLNLSDGIIGTEFPENFLTVRISEYVNPSERGLIAITRTLRLSDLLKHLVSFIPDPNVPDERVLYRVISGPGFILGEVFGGRTVTYLGPGYLNFSGPTIGAEQTMVGISSGTVATSLSPGLPAGMQMIVDKDRDDIDDDTQAETVDRWNHSSFQIDRFIIKQRNVMEVLRDLALQYKAIIYQRQDLTQPKVVFQGIKTISDIDVNSPGLHEYVLSFDAEIFKTLDSNRGLTNSVSKFDNEVYTDFPVYGSTVGVQFTKINWDLVDSLGRHIVRKPEVFSKINDLLSVQLFSEALENVFGGSVLEGEVTVKGFWPTDVNGELDINSTIRIIDKRMTSGTSLIGTGNVFNVVAATYNGVRNRTTLTVSDRDFYSFSIRQLEEMRNRLRGVEPSLPDKDIRRTGRDGGTGIVAASNPNRYMALYSRGLE
ncbi:MAG: hypothetical protein ACXQTL_07515, partial [Methanosarcinales archaeon]